MISNQILQTTLEGLKSITRVDLSICDTEGKVLGGFILAAIEYERLCDSEATSLRAPVATSSASDTYFSLAGISRSSVGKGIYVRQGKKVIR